MELRKDYFLDKWVIVASDRKKRPQQFKKDSAIDNSACFFCPGKENSTPQEIGRLEQDGKWQFRWFPNKFPFLQPVGISNIETHNQFFTFSDAFGYHEVLVETPDHDKQLWDLDASMLEKLLRIYNERIESLSKKPSIKYVSVFKNHGPSAGTSLFHSHTQIAATNLIPTEVLDECKAGESDCLYCKIINIEKNSFRRCFENDSFVAFTPYASRFGFEIWLFPKDHVRKMSELTDANFRDMAQILHKILLKLKEINLSYNLIVHYSPEGKNLHFHLELCPRVSTWAGFELSSGIIVNAIPPEDAAKFYRGEE